MHRRVIIKTPLLLFLYGCSSDGCYKTFSGNYVSNPFWSSSDVLYGPTQYRKYQIKLRRFEWLDLMYQESQKTCWAAAIQATYLYNDKYISQNQIISKVRDDIVEERLSSATLTEIIEGVSETCGSWSVNNGIGALIIRDLEQTGSPVIVGIRTSDKSMGHVVVVYGVSVLLDPMGMPTNFIDRVYLWDPDEEVGFSEMSGQEMKDSIIFALHSWNPKYTFSY